jgi:endonuclease YncB( thermonuclease family)
MIKPTQNIILILVLVILSNYSFGKSISKSNRVIDGDTIVLNSKKIRFHGIDTPETHQKCKNDKGFFYACGLKATKELKKIIGKNKVICKQKTTDRYRRSISVCFVNGKNINSLMVKSGWALAYRKYSKDYVKDEEEAKKRKIGLWAGEFTPPWEWRRLKK